LDELIADARPDVIHITTPPASHFELAMACLDNGCHVYVEKPVTLFASEVETLIARATATGLRLTAGHDDQFTHVARRMRSLVRKGYLGGAPLHMESYYCYDLSDPSYARALLGDKRHWVRQLPGKLLQNIISHGIARIAEFLTSDAPIVIAHGFTSPVLKRLNEHAIIDELRVIIVEGERTTAYFTFSSQMRPSLHQLRLYGPKNGLVLDHDQDSLIPVPGTRYKSYAEKFVPHLFFAKQHLANVSFNARTFLARDFHMKSGMKHLMESFYSSISEGGPLPISYDEILRTARIMDEIFIQLKRQRESVPLESSPDFSLSASPHLR
jgi:predicted dehydrogenase